MTARQVVLTIPEQVLTAEHIDAETFAHELQMLAAVKLYELGRLSADRAAELAGMSKVEFLFTLEKYQVFPFAAELDDLEHSDA